jgi:hypothetical protein
MGDFEEVSLIPALAGLVEEKGRDIFFPGRAARTGADAVLEEDAGEHVLKGEGGRERGKEGA